MRKFISLLLLLMLIGINFAQSNTENIKDAISMLCALFYGILPIGVLMSATLAGVIFALGHMSGAETRARANVWATNLLIGAITAGVVIVIAPAVVNTLLGGVDLEKTCVAPTSSQENQFQDCINQCNDNRQACYNNCEAQGGSPAQVLFCKDNCDELWDCQEICTSDTGTGTTPGHETG